MPSSVAVQPDGDIVVVGSSETTQDGFGFAMARFTPNGQLGTTFGNVGLVRVQLPGMVHGSYNSDGSLDTSFGTGGFADATNAVSPPSALALLADGSDLAVGRSGAVAEFSSTEFCNQR
jgi:uncharacterized delta-60 repeat protein